MRHSPDLDPSSVYHFIGLGGIGMSALARILHQKGMKVQGSDASDSPLLARLRGEGIESYVGHEPHRVRGAGCVVYSTSISSDNVELQEAKRLGLVLLHRSDLLHLLARRQQPLFVTGAHGKTTTSSLLAWTLAQASCDPSFALGGIVLDWNTNGGGGQGEFFVAEADESDGSFLKTCPYGAIVTNMDREHMDYWQTVERLEQAFDQFGRSVREERYFFWCREDEKLASLFANRGFSYGFSARSALRISGLQQTERGLSFHCTFLGKLYERIEVPLCGRHNALNSAAVFGLGLQLGIEEDRLRLGLRTFPGVKRRLEWKGRAHKVDIFDDYGHHPAEIRATLRALRERIREKRLIVVFQPHRYTRLRDLFSAFSQSFEEADLIVLTQVYSASEAPIEGYSAESLLIEMQKSWGEKIHFALRSELEDQVISLMQPLDVVLTLGAGDITDASELILQKWSATSPKLRVGVLFGGHSVEHEVSCSSAKNLLKGLASPIYEAVPFFIPPLETGFVKNGLGEVQSSPPTNTDPGLKTWVFTPRSEFSCLQTLSSCDVVIPVFHGPRGEDGMIQGFLETMRIPYAGCGYGSSAACMHKGWTKRIAQSHGIATASFLEKRKGAYCPEAFAEEVETLLSYPVWVKPVHLGSSLGVGRAENRQELLARAEAAFALDDWILVEEHKEGRQIEFGLLGNAFLRVGPACEILSGGAFVDYEGKYGDKAMGYAIAARLSEEEAERGAFLAKKIYEILGCEGLARIDFFIDAEGVFWLNEVNPFPGLTDTSAFPQLWEKGGMGMEDLCDALIVCAFHRARRR